jgi:hypothetical protein
LGVNTEGSRVRLKTQGVFLGGGPDLTRHRAYTYIHTHVLYGFDCSPWGCRGGSPRRCRPGRRPRAGRARRRACASCRPAPMCGCGCVCVCVFVTKFYETRIGPKGSRQQFGGAGKIGPARVCMHVCVCVCVCACVCDRSGRRRRSVRSVNDRSVDHREKRPITSMMR